MQAQINCDTYISAKWRAEVCRSGENGIETYYPFGEEMRPNMILDSWLETMVICPILAVGSCTAINNYSQIYMANMVNGYMRIGTGNTPLDYSQTQLAGYSKQTNYIRPDSTGAYYYDDYVSGSRTYSKTYEFAAETVDSVYREAGFKSDYASFWTPQSFSVVPPHKLNSNVVFSRFLFPSDLNLYVGDILKIKYDVGMRIPMLTGSAPMTGTGLSYGDFNGTGQMKLFGRFDSLFGGINSNGVASGDGEFRGIFWGPGDGYGFTNTVGINTSANLVHTGVDFPSINSTTDVARVLLQSTDYTPSAGPHHWPTKYYNTVTTGNFSWGDKFFDIKHKLLASYPNYDLQVGGIVFAPAGNNGYGEYAPTTDFGWYWKFDSPQTKYQDQLWEVTYRFSANRG